MEKRSAGVALLFAPVCNAYLSDSEQVSGSWRVYRNGVQGVEASRLSLRCLYEVFTLGREISMSEVRVFAHPAGLKRGEAKREILGAPFGLQSAWLYAALLLFLLQTLPFLSYRWVTDESWYAGTGFSIAQGHGIADPAIGPNDIENHFAAKPPGTPLVIGGMFRLLGVGASEARLGSVLAGFSVVLMTFLLMRALFGSEAAAVAALLVATDNLMVLTSRTARPEALMTMAIVMAMAAMKRYADRGAVAWSFLCGLLMAMAAMFHVTVAGYMCSFGALALALDLRTRRFWLPGTFLYVGGVAAGLAPYVAWIVRAPLGRQAFAHEFLSRAGNTSLLSRLFEEKRRYADLIGLKMLHGHGLESIPARLPIPLLFLFACYLLWQFRRSWFYVELLLLLPTMAWLVFMVFKSSRYLALLAPVFAMAIGAAIAAARERQLLHKTLLAMAGLAVVAQFGANLLLLRAARTANFTRLTQELRAVIPADEPVYGTITFWLAFHDRPFISYERTEPAMAAQEDHVRYFIAGDRMMTSPDVFGEKGFYQDLNREMDELEARSDLAAEVVDPYYGDLKVYRLREGMQLAGAGRE